VGLVYIAQWIQCEPLDQTDLSNVLDASYEAMGNQHIDEAERWALVGLGGLQVGPGSPTITVLSLALVMWLLESSGTFWSWFRGGILIFSFDV